MATKGGLASAWEQLLPDHKQVGWRHPPRCSSSALLPWHYAEPVIRTAWEWGRNAEIRRDGPLQGPPSWELKERGGCEISLWGAAWHWSVQTCNLHPISFRKPRKTVWWEQQEGRLSWYVSLSLILIFVFGFGMNDQRSPWPNALQIGGFGYAVGFQWDEKTGACRLSGCRSVSFPSDTGQ